MLEIKESNAWANIWGMLQLLWRRKFIVAAIIAVALLGAYINYMSSSPVYRSSSILMIDHSESGRRLYSEEGAEEAVNTERLETDLAIIKSFPLAERVVDSLYSSPYRDSLEIFGKRSYKTNVELFFENLFGKSDSEEIELVQQEVVAQGNRIDVGEVSEQEASGQHVGQRNEVQEDEAVPRDFSRRRRQFAETLQARVLVENQPGTNIINVSIASPFPDESALLTNTICRIYQSWNIEQALSFRDFIRDQLKEQDAKVTEVENALSGYMRDENIYELTGNAGQLLAQVVSIESRYNGVEAEANILKRRLEYLTNKLSGEERELSERVARSLAQRLNDFKDNIRKEEKVLQDLILSSGKEDPAVQSKQAEVDGMKARLNQMTRSQIAGELGYAARTRQYKYDLISEQLQTDLRLAELKYSANELLRLKQYYESELEKLPEKQLEYARLQRDRTVMNNTYSVLQGRLREAEIDIASKTGEVVIVGEAFPPDGPISPNLKKNLLLGLLSGLGMSVLLVYVMNLFDDTIRDEQFFDEHDYIILARIPFLGESRRKSLSGLDKTNVLAKMPFIGKFGGTSTADPDEVHAQERGSASPILITEELSSAFAESFRDLRTNLGLFHDNSKLKSLLVTGTSVSEGKSTVCANLGLSMAMLSKKVIIVDCDLRRPSQHDFFYASKNPGVSDFLAGDAENVGDADVQATGYENLFILPAGSPVSNPNELLYSSRMPKLIAELKKHYDLVLLDSPPMLLLSDAAVLSQSVDGVLLTGRMRYSSKKHFKELKKLVFLKENLLGVVLIGDTFQKKYGKYGYSYKHLDHYSSEKK